MSACLICLADTPGDYHDDCLRELFGAPTPPVIDLELSKLHTFALAMVGRVSLSGIQRKISLALTADRLTLRVAVGPGRYILKPAAQTYPALPENEHVTMRLARLVGLETPSCGLVRLKDGSLAYVVCRFDRRADGSKRRQEDFCQLAQLSPKEKYDGSAERCARIVREFASEPGIELPKLFRLVVFGWWSGNGDMHLKNLSLLTGDDGRHRLSPVYDQVCTRLVIPDDLLALPIGGKKDGITRRDLLAFADDCGVRRPIAERVLSEVVAAAPAALDLCARSWLDAEMRAAYAELLRERTAALGTGAMGRT